MRLSAICLPISASTTSGKTTVKMPKGPKGEKRPADVIGAAVKVMKIATGQISEDIDQADTGKDKAAVELGRKGGRARAEKLPARRRREIARKAAAARWDKPSDT